MFPPGFTCPAVLWIPTNRIRVFRLRDSHPLRDRPSHAVRLTYCMPLCGSTTPKTELLPPVWPPPRSLATTSGISVDVFSSPYLDVSVQAVPRVRLFYSTHADTSIARAGFPHSDISGSMRMCRSPKLFAACHVLLRLLMPRHSPCALFSLT